MAAERLGVDPNVARAMERHVPAARRREAASDFLGGGTTMAKMVMLDARSVPGFAAKCRLVASHMFPDAEYMREAFGVRSAPGLVAAYARRATTAAWRLVVPEGRPS